ncbi:MAG TPA: hypothetical protein PKE64_02560 [Anaerolineae bacterium]|nr:hypothetical protein [Anaerolineae bacterium]
MLPPKHALISASIGTAGWWLTGQPKACLVALASGVLPDLDHLIDYAYYNRRGEHRLILPLHGYEFALLGTIIALRGGHKVLSVAVISYFVHLLADQAENRTRRWGYSLLFRVWHHFRLEAISTMPEAASRGRVEDMDLLKSLLFRRRKRPNSPL